MSAFRGRPPARMILEQALAQWRQWRCSPPLAEAPRLHATLNGGLSNCNYLVAGAGRRFVVRVDGVNPAVHGINRRAEWLALQSAAAAGIAATPRYCNPELGVLVCDFVPGEVPQHAAPEELAVLLRAIHRLPRRHHKLDRRARLKRYEQLAESRGRPTVPVALQRRLGEVVEAAQRHDPGPVLCHNDLNRSNLLRSEGRLIALDWEYCAMGSPWFDLAAISLSLDLDRDRQQALVRAYLDSSAGPPQYRQLWRHRVIVRYFELLWHLCECPRAAAAETLTNRLALLRAELLEAGR